MGRQYNLQASWVGITIYNAFNNNIACIKLASNPITPAPCLPSSSKISRGAFITGVISPIVLLHQLSAASPLSEHLSSNRAPFVATSSVVESAIGASSVAESSAAASLVAAPLVTVLQFYTPSQNFTRINLTSNPITCGSLPSDIIDRNNHLRQGSPHV